MNDDELVNNALELKRLDQSVVKAVVDCEIDKLLVLLQDFTRVRRKIQIQLVESATIEIHEQHACRILQKISAGLKFHSDDIIAILKTPLDGTGNIEDLTDEEIDELGSRLFYSWISHYEYIRNLFKINTLIIGVKIPENLITYVTEARNCFSFEQYNAVIALSRAIIEAAAKDICFRLNYLDSDGSALISIDPTVFNQILRLIASGPFKRKVTKLYYRACPVVHGDRIVSDSEAARVFRLTIEIVQDLYLKNGF